MASFYTTFGFFVTDQIVTSDQLDSLKKWYCKLENFKFEENEYTVIDSVRWTFKKNS
jgi:hypothetical protein